MQKLSRKEAFSFNPVLSNHLMILQDDKYNPAHYPVQEGDEVFLEEENMSVTLTKEEADQINTDDLTYYRETKDNYAIDPSLAWVAGEKYIPTNKTTDEYLQALGSVFKTIAETQSSTQLLALGDWPTPWLAEKGDTPAMQDAYKFFKSNCKPKFNGGFQVSTEELNTFIPHLFWLTRGSSILPDFLMAFDKGKTVFSICQYGVLHLECYDSNEAEQLQALFQHNNFKAVKECADHISF